MKPVVYIETTVISYLTAWPSRDVIRLAQQQQTREWWDTQRQFFEAVCSEVVEREAAVGDSTAAAERLKILQTLPLLAVKPEAGLLAADLIAKVKLPARAQTDALHVAIAATNGVSYLLTWNCRHLTNAVLRPRIEQVCRDNGLEPPLICTPADLMEPP
ncbi:MAG TPA: type II toxin-antitoxin system VapC family toxin [Humisphaera sp.]|jgi:predicted nucleic acid-binding protein|nr:type II toxin-antitoxin system VapC family toxin [Humisphaera sp.]